jgi:type III secretion protein V
MKRPFGFETLLGAHVPRPAGLAGWAAVLTPRLTPRGDLALLGLLMAIIALLVLPVPAALLDGLIALNLALSIGLLMLSMYVGSSLGLSTFPSLLLFTTLLRLSLNIASSKQILLHAHAGQIIDTFGRLVVGGSVVVGIVVFLIIAIVQFIVVAKGAERVAEVGARFTLDGMPGKQMSIDADLRAGIVGKDEARRRRGVLEQESQFFGAMDGAMKFVKGDAIAGMIIAFVNIVAGIAVGMAMKDMGFAQALQRYTVLTVGDGMVTQIPSLFVSIAAGVLITRVGADDARDANLGSQIGRQVLAQPLALLLTAGVLCAFVLTPGFPKLPFGLLAAALAGIAWFVMRSPSRRRSFENAPMPAMARDGVTEVPPLIHRGDDDAVAPLVLRLAPDCGARIAPAALDRALMGARRRIRRELGIPFPGLVARFDDTLAEGAYAIDVHELPRASGVLTSDMSVRDGSDGDPAAQLIHDIEQAVLSQPDLFIGFAEAHQMVEAVGRESSELAQELVRTVPLQRIADVLRRLVQESISIRPVREICESLLAWGAREKDPVLLTEYVRIDLGRHIAHRFGRGERVMPVLMLDPAAEQLVRQAVQQTATGSYLALGPDDTRRLGDAAEHALHAAGAALKVPVVVASMDVRRYVRRLLEPRMPQVVVLSYQEIGSHLTLQTVGRVGLAREAA